MIKSKSGWARKLSIHDTQGNCSAWGDSRNHIGNGLQILGIDVLPAVKMPLWHFLKNPLSHCGECIHFFNGQIRIRQIDPKVVLNKDGDSDQGMGVNEPPCNERLIFFQRIGRISDNFRKNKISQLFIDLCFFH